VKRVLAASSKDDASARRWAPVQHMLAAAAGDVASSTVRVPFEVVKQRLQSGVNKTASGAVRAIFAQQGVRGFFTGYSSLVIRELPFDAIQFPLYELLKSQVAKRSPTGKIETWQSSLCGSAAGGFAAAITTPLDVVKTRIMTQAPITTGNPRKYTGIIQALGRIAREEGASGLFSGITPRVMWIR
jgi:solute carrier family 25 (mitochondrial S-adenosylmethionine transporter), member 26